MHSIDHGTHPLRHLSLFFDSSLTGAYSTQCYYDPQSVSQSSLLAHLIAAEHALPDSTSDMHFHSRKFEFPIVLDDRWNRDALERYMWSVRGKAVYLPSNIEYLARNNGLGGAEEALRLLVGTSWVRWRCIPRRVWFI